MNTSHRNVGKTRRARRDRQSPNQLTIEKVLEGACHSEEAIQNLIGLIQSRDLVAVTSWRGRDSVPPGTLLEKICDAFGQGSNIPLELPTSILMLLISGRLLQLRAVINTPSGKIHPKLWCIVLANSSSGKTFTYHQLRNGLGIPDPEIPGIAGAATSAGFFEVLRACPQGLFVRDEFGQLVGRIERDQNMADFKDQMLRTYDGQPLVWTTKKDGARVIESPQISVLGLTQLDTWHDKVSAESMLDGFAARFSYVIARADPERDWRDFPIWKIDSSTWANEWQKCAAAIQPEYTTTAESEAHFCRAFRALARGSELPEPFFRRILFSGHRLACIYHVLLADPSPYLNEVDYGWALRLIRHHLADAISVLGERNCSEIEHLVRSAEDLRERMRIAGQPFNERTLYRNFRALTPATAGVIMRLLQQTPSTYDPR